MVGYASSILYSVIGGSVLAVPILNAPDTWRILMWQSLRDGGLVSDFFQG